MFDSYEDWLECVLSDISSHGVETIAQMLGITAAELRRHIARYEEKHTSAASD